MEGFGHYEEMIAEIRNVPGVAAAMPVLETYGLVNIGNAKTTGVQVMGFDIERIGQVNEFPRSLWFGYNVFLDPLKDPTLSKADRDKAIAEAEEHAAHPSWKKPLEDQAYRDILNWKEGKSRGKDPATLPPMIVGAGILEIRKDETGAVVGREGFKYRLPVKLTVLGISADFGSIDVGDKSERSYWIVDDSRTQVWQYDNSFVYVPFDQLQSDLKMTAQKYTDKRTGKEEEIPARTSQIHIRVKEGQDLEAVRKQIEPIVNRVYASHQPTASLRWDPPVTQTWRQAQHTYLDAIQKEKQLTVFLFALISVVAVFLIFCIFYMIVAEKTRDIGIIKSVGATASGVAGIFLGYGLVIGIVGGGCGLLASWLIVRNINEIHEWMGRRLHMTVWNPEVYLFDKIPNTMDPFEVSIIVSIAVIASVLGALVPAVHAARMNPVEALRWE
jgi:lipoprotein-releasing system permease protein